MFRPAVVSLCFAVLAFGLAGCPNPTDLGSSCWLVKGQDAEGNPIYITNGEIVEGLEYISHGATECENWVCVRDGRMPKDAQNPDAAAAGYCSNSCVPGPDSACIPQNRAHADPESPEYLSCREISLDPELLAFFRDNDPDQYRRLFGDSATPYYCARGAGPGN